MLPSDQMKPPSSARSSNPIPAHNDIAGILRRMQPRAAVSWRLTAAEVVVGGVVGGVVRGGAGGGGLGLLGAGMDRGERLVVRAAVLLGLGLGHAVGAHDEAAGAERHGRRTAAAGDRGGGQPAALGADVGRAAGLGAAVAAAALARDGACDGEAVNVWQEARQINRESMAILQTEPTGQKPLPVPHSCWAFRSETEGMFLGQPRDELPVLGQERLAVLMVSDNPPARILDLQDFWNGLRTFAVQPLL